MYNNDILQYIEEHSEKEHPFLYNLYRNTNIHTVHGRMASGHLQGIMLKMFVEMIQPKNILEVGTFSGYSAIAMAMGLPQCGLIHTFEINDEMEDFTRAQINASGYGHKINFMIGDANVLAPQLNIIFDMAFIDGDKRTYIETYEMVLKIMKKGGFILADNTLWDGHIVDPSYAKDAQTQGIIAFNELIKNDNRVEKIILPLRDGLTIIRKK